MNMKHMPMGSAEIGDKRGSPGETSRQTSGEASTGDGSTATENPRLPRQGSIVGGKDGQKYRFTVLADGLVRYEWAPDGQFEDRPSSFAYQRNRAGTDEFRLRESDAQLEIITSRFHLTYNKEAFSPHGLFVLVFGHTRSLWRYGYNKPWENLGGTVRTLDGVDGRTDWGTGIMSQKGYTTIDDSESMLLEEDGFVASRRAGSGRVDGYLFAYGHDYRDAIKAFYTISGFPPLLPRWALGNWWSRYYAYSAESYIELMKEFEKHRIPLSVAVLDMDWHLVDDPRVKEAGQTGWTGYTWNRELFPDPPAFMAELHRRGLKTPLNDHPADGIHSYEDMYHRVAEAMGHDTSNKEPIEFDMTDRNFVRAYLDVLLRSLEDDGCDFWWIDWQQGEYSRMRGVDPLWMLNHFHFRHMQDKRDRGETAERPLILSRYAGPGSHRYPIGFSGDTAASWASLAFQPAFTATASNVGYGWWSHDVGGHMAGGRDDELLARWVQLGVFSPVMRLHSSKSPWVHKEPWALPTGGPRETAAAFLALRHRLIPYLHCMNIRASAEGLPLVQPMYWEHPHRDEAYRFENQYLFGSGMVVMPITEPRDPELGLAKVKGWLPPGRYVDYFSGVAYSGDRELWVSRPLDGYPVFMREGSIVPLWPGGMTSQNRAVERSSAGVGSIELVVAVGADGAFTLIEEPDKDEPRGRNMDYEDSSTEDSEGGEGGEGGDLGKIDDYTPLDTGPDPDSDPDSDPRRWPTTRIRFDQASGTVEIGPALNLRPGCRGSGSNWTLRLVGYDQVNPDFPRLVLGNEPVAEESHHTPSSRHQPGGPGDITRTDSGLLFSFHRPYDAAVTVRLGPNPRLRREEPLGRIEAVLDRAQVDYALKESIWAALSAEPATRSARLGRLETVQMGQNLRVAITEYLLADDRV